MRLLVLAAALMVTMISPFPIHAQDTPRRIVALGDSLTAGYGLADGQSFTTLLAQALNDKDENVVVDNAGISGDTTAGGLARLEDAISGDPKPSLVLVALGANDMMRGIDPAQMKENLNAILQTLKDRNIPALLIGVRMPGTVSGFYGSRYDDVYEDLADKFDIRLYESFLDGVAMDPDLNQSDGIHPNLAGTKIMVKRLLPTVRKALND